MVCMGPGRVLKMEKVPVVRLTGPWNIVWESGLHSLLPPRQPTAEAGNADTAGFLCCWPGRPGLFTQLCLSDRNEAWSAPPDFPPTHTLNKDPFRPEPVWSKVETKDSYPSTVWAQYWLRRSSQGFSGVEIPGLISPQASPQTVLEIPPQSFPHGPGC